MDFLELFQRYGCRMQTGGSDQWGNLTAGTDLIRKVTGEAAHVIATPLITDSSGKKVGKSTGGGGLWLDPEITSPYAWYQYLVNIEDALVGQLLRALTFLDREEIAVLEKETADRPQARAGQRRLAEELTVLVHGRAETDQVVAASKALFGRGELAELRSSTLRAALTEAGLVTVRADPGTGAMPSVAGLFRDAGLTASLSEARRTVAEGGAYVNNRRMAEADAPISPDDLLHGRWLVLRRGKRTIAGVELAVS
jgi:tyrosyl-tRNA synthetase